MDKNDFAIAIALIAAGFAGWQAWTAYQERNTPLQVLVYQSQVEAIQTLAENARISCRSVLCESSGIEKYDVCKGDELENAFAKVETAVDTMKLFASPILMELVTRFSDMHRRYSLHSDQVEVDLPPSLKTDLQSIKWARFRKCDGEIDHFANDFRQTLGLSRLSEDLLKRLAETDRRKLPNSN